MVPLSTACFGIWSVAFRAAEYAIAVIADRLPSSPTL